MTRLVLYVISSYYFIGICCNISKDFKVVNRYGNRICSDKFIRFQQPAETVTSCLFLCFLQSVCAAVVYQSSTKSCNGLLGGHVMSDCTIELAGGEYYTTKIAKETTVLHQWIQDVTNISSNYINARKTTSAIKGPPDGLPWYILVPTEPIWIEVTFAKAVRITGVNIYNTWRRFTISGISAVQGNGDRYSLWNGSNVYTWLDKTIFSPQIKIKVNSANPTLVMIKVGKKGAEEIPGLVEHFVGNTPLRKATGMEQTFKEKRALVTGAGKGLGRAISIKLVNLGAHVIALSRTQSDLDTLKAEFPSIEICQLDIKDWDNTRETVEKLGHVDLLVNNAGIVSVTPFLEVPKDEFNSIHDVNFRAAFNISQVVARGMVAKGNGGAIVNVSSVASIRAVNGLSAYCMTKAALDMLTQTLALELGPSKIRVNSINPGLVMTNMGKKVGEGIPGLVEVIVDNTPLKKIAEEEDVVNAVMFLLSDKASMINGVIMPIDGGITIRCV